MKRVQQLISSHINIWATTETEKKSGRGRSSSNAKKIYGIEKLRQLILDLAIRGKLVLQDPKDESAKELLLRIQDRLTSENKLGKKKGPQEFKEQQMPFELPKTWVCLKLRDTYQSISPLGKQLKTSQIKVKGKFPVIDQGQLYITGYTDINENVIKIPHPVIVFGDHTRNIKFINFDFVAGADGTKILAPILINPKFFYYQLLSYRVESKGYARHFKTLNENFIAIPPLTEQKRIVSKVDELMALCDQLEQKHINSQVIHEKLVKVLLEALTQSKDEVEFKDSWQRIAKHFNTLFTTVDTINKLKHTIFELAIRGKLVLQDPKDESAKELLLRIQDRLTSENKLGKKKGPQEFKEQQMPFELPKTWVCLKLRDTYQSISPLGKQLKTSQIKVKGKFPVIDQGQLYITGYTDINENVIKIPHPVIVFGDHTRNIKFINFDFVAGADGTKILAPILINPKFFYYQLLSYRVESKGYARHFKTLNENFIAIPPLTEQKRIVSKVDELIALCDEFKSRIQQASMQQKQIADVLVSQALN